MRCVHCGKVAATKAETAGGGVEASPVAAAVTTDPAEPRRRLPKGWKREGKSPVCRRCWADRRVPRLVALPVVSPSPLPWAAFRSALRPHWRESAKLANWIATEMAKADAMRGSEGEGARLPKRPRFDPYKRFNGTDGRGPGYPDRDWWDGMTQSANILIRRVDAAYRAARDKVVGTMEWSLPSYRYPHPFLLDADSWKVVPDAGGALLVSVRLKEGWCPLRLRGGPEFRRQMVAFRQVADGSAIRGEAMICQQGRDKHVVFKFLGQFPRAERGEADRTMLVRTDPNAFWVTEVEGRAAWILNADHVRRWVAAHRVYLQRIAEDTKREKRWPRQVIRNVNVAREKRCEKHNDRIDSWNHEATAMLVGFAARNRVETLIYDDTCSSYLPKYPWHDLRAKLAYKLGAAGIEFIHRPSEPTVGRDEEGNDHDHDHAQQQGVA